MSEVAVKLEACPFCGITLQGVSPQMGGGHSGYRHEATKSKCILRGYCINKSQIDDWNTCTSPWISVADRLPEDLQSVTIIRPSKTDDGGTLDQYFRIKGQWCYCSTAGEVKHQPLFWQEIAGPFPHVKPDPPQEKT